MLRNVGVGDIDLLAIGLAYFSSNTVGVGLFCLRTISVLPLYRALQRAEIRVSVGVVVGSGMVDGSRMVVGGGGGSGRGMWRIGRIFLGLETVHLERLHGLNVIDLALLGQFSTRSLSGRLVDLCVSSLGFLRACLFTLVLPGALRGWTGGVNFILVSAVGAAAARAASRAALVSGTTTVVALFIATSTLLEAIATLAPVVLIHIVFVTVVSLALIVAAIEAATTIAVVPMTIALIVRCRSRYDCSFSDSFIFHVDIGLLAHDLKFRVVPCWLFLHGKELLSSFLISKFDENRTLEGAIIVAAKANAANVEGREQPVRTASQ